jgi:hypothetical protein
MDYINIDKILDVVLAVLIGIVLAICLVSWWSN